MNELGSTSRPLRVAVIGSGPAGFYAAEALFKSPMNVYLDVFDRLPTPYGLVRAGVAPDHQKLKNVIKVYERIAANEAFHFWGNVAVGRDVSVEELRNHYDGIIVASGAETDRKLGIPGEDLRGSYTATEFVGWYNGHPDYQDRVFDLSGEVAVVIGQGNVAMDVSRILAKTVDELKHTDITDRALEALAQSKITEIHVIGRRGPVQTKFTPPEIKELGELVDCDPVVDEADFEFDPACLEELEDAKNTHARKNVEVLRGYAARKGEKTKRCHLRFRLSPVALEGEGKLERVVLEKNRLTGEPFRRKASGTGERSPMDCSIFFRSVGYRGVAIPGIPFDERSGIIPSVKGRVTEGDEPIPGIYVSGWIKRGPSGVIGTNKPDSYETVKTLLEDVPGLTPCPHPESASLGALLAERGVRVVTFEDWREIDRLEIERGRAKGKPREKFVSVEEMIRSLG
jgi:ferredoxin--NADP+ reductase